MWAAGVILLSILSRRYPFFKAKDDMEALAQIITIFGSAKLKKMADVIGECLVRYNWCGFIGVVVELKLGVFQLIVS